MGSSSRWLRGSYQLRGVASMAVVALLLGLPCPAVANADDIRPAQWQLGFLRIDEAWKYSTGRGEVVAVIDSGVDATHPDLAGRVLPGRDFVDGSTDGRQDIVGHGTAVASLIAGVADDRGVVGIAPDAKILPIRVLDARNEYDSASVVASAVRWATDHGAGIINLSLGSGRSSQTLSDALSYAFDHDVVVVACTGNVSNHQGSRVWHPAREPGVVAVAGVTDRGSFWQGSLSGTETVAAAPATQIVVAHPGGRYQTVKGTSFAAPLVAASAALVRAAYPKLSAASIVERLISTAWDYGPPGKDDQFGYGVINPARALTARVKTVTANPLRDRSVARVTAEDTKLAAGADPKRPGELRPTRVAEPLRQRPPSISRLLPLTAIVIAVLAATCCLAALLHRRRRRADHY